MHGSGSPTGPGLRPFYTSPVYNSHLAWTPQQKCSCFHHHIVLHSSSSAIVLLNCNNLAEGSWLHLIGQMVWMRSPWLHLIGQIFYWAWMHDACFWNMFYGGNWHWDDDESTIGSALSIILIFVSKDRAVMFPGNSYLAHGQSGLYRKSPTCLVTDPHPW